MKEILLIAPYQDMLELARQIITDFHFDDVEAVKGDLEEGLRIATNAVESHTKVIISRGGTYRLIRDVVCFPVVEIRSSLYDLLDTLSQVIKHPAPLAIVGFSNIVDGYDLDFLQTILKTPVRKVDLQRGQDVEQVITECAREGCTVFLGDAVVQKACEKLGFSCYLQKSGKNAILSAIEAAQRLLKASKQEVEFAKRLRTIIDCVQEGVVATDRDHKVIIYNAIAQRLFGQRIEEVLNKDIRSLAFLGAVAEEIASQGRLIDQVRTISDQVFSISCIPIEVAGEYFGSVAVLRDIHELQNFEKKLRVMLATKGFVARHSFDSIIYASNEMEQCITIAKKFSQYDVSVLIEGQSGVGKELFAQSIHNASMRRSGPFVAINCAALPKSLIESELFGHVEGAFTGSRKGGKTGVFEMAHKGTLLLDEIGDLPIDVQGQLLRVIQEREVMRLGDNRMIPIDVRLICCTNRDLGDMVREGKFRRDLLHRINTLALYIPSLDKRTQDIPMLARHFLTSFCTKYGKVITDFSQQAIEYLTHVQYEGNVRQLRGMMERTVIICDGPVVRLSDLTTGRNYEQPVENQPLVFDSRTMPSLGDLEKRYVREIMEKSGGSVTDAAAILGISRSTLWRKLKDIK